jgi:predicted ATP-dependent endonuclease of OLD family
MNGVVQRKMSDCLNNIAFTPSGVTVFLGEISMTQKTDILSPGLRLSRLTIENYKRLDKLEIEFPPPLMAGDVDILVFGSENGVGKTSVLECCALLMLAVAVGEIKVQHRRESEWLSELVKAGQQQALIIGEFKQKEKTCQITLKINTKGFDETILQGDELLLKQFHDARKQLRSDDLEDALNRILALSGEPLIMPPLLHFNSYRKVQESNPELGMMIADSSGHRNSNMSRPERADPLSFFKLEVMHSLMAKASLLEGFNKGESEMVLSQLNSLVERYCGGSIENLRLLPDNTVDIRIKPVNGESSFSFNGLSSGQKEMIATLFLIWKNTHKQPSIVLIDEPELHLNAEWHGEFVEQLRSLAPYNQYILATHSEEIFRSVDESYRAILGSSILEENKGDILWR